MGKPETNYTVYKKDQEGKVVWSYPATVISRSPTAVQLEAYFNVDDIQKPYALLKRGDRYIEYFFADRWYNIFAIYDRDDHGLKGWYCNICRPAEIGPESVGADDLELDLWIDGMTREQLVLDEDEFEALSLSEVEKQAALDALAELQEMGRTGRLPY